MGVTADHLENAPKYADENSWNWSDQTRTRAVNDYYAGLT
jgi:hypothetical protein